MHGDNHHKGGVSHFVRNIKKYAVEEINEPSFYKSLCKK